MRIVRNLDRPQKNASKRLILAIGNFDGFHRGHQKLLAYVAVQAKKHGALSAVLTFPRHPQSVLHPEKKQRLLYPLEQKLYYLARSGINLCFLQPFTTSFSQMTPKEFAAEVLVKKLHVLEVVMGHDAHFGHGRRGTTAMMRRLAGKYGFLFKRMRPVTIGGKTVSSSLIREQLASGELEKVQACLGRPFSLFGKVVAGKGHGRHLGFPTANLEVHSNVLVPRGVYIASARMLSCGPRPGVRGPEVWLPGAVNYGKRPTYPARETPRPVLELHLLDFKGNVRGRTMEVALHKFLRPERRFRKEEALKRQIARDITAVRNHFSR